MLKIPAEYERDTSSAKFTAISYQISPASTLDASAGFCQRALVDELGMIRTQMGYVQYMKNGRSAWDALCDTTP
jgi:hypothetical protein